jgi:hypothetical protein
MDNSIFVFSNKDQPLILERFHICTWEFIDDTSLIEFGFEISKDSIQGNSLTISLFVPWITTSCEKKDLYDKLSIQENIRFIFNDNVINTIPLDGGRNKLGVIHKFIGRNELCILPVKLLVEENKIISATINLQPYLDYNSDHNPNIYFRFWVKPSIPYISIRKKGISKSTIIYDIKVNERRNIPDDKVEFFSQKELSTIESCFSFNILPNKYDIIFFDNSSLKNVRTLEYDSFNKYLGDKRVKKDELIVVFNKKQKSDSFSFFSIYSKERIGPGHFSLAILINIFCGILLFIPSYRKSFEPEMPITLVWKNLPGEIFVAIIIALAMVLFFIWPKIQKYLTNWRD